MILYIMIDTFCTNYTKTTEYTDQIYGLGRVTGDEDDVWYKTWPRLKLWLAENFHNHDMGVKPGSSNRKPFNMNKLFVKIGNDLTTLWETVIVSNDNVKEPTKMLARAIICVNPNCFSLGST